jgi:hypothetical protein
MRQHYVPIDIYNALSSDTYVGFLILATITCGTAIISNYAFPKQRKFPNVVLVWSW